MSHHRKKATLTAPTLNLFPFLSIFLCIMGVLAFLQTLMAATNSTKIEIHAGQYDQFAEPYQIFCRPDGYVLIPPLDQLPQLINSVKNSEEKARLITIKTARAAAVQAMAQKTAPTGQFLDDQQIVNILEELVFINNIARNNNQKYEEFLLFGIYPASTEYFHHFRTLMYDTRFEGLKKGYEVLDNDWQFLTTTGSLNEKNEP